MTITTNIKDHETGNVAQVTKNHALKVTLDPGGGDLPSVGTKNRYRFLTGNLGTAGLNAGVTNSNVDGSVTPQTFYIDAHVDYDIYVMRISILIADSAITHNTFGAVGVLTNGWNLYIQESGDFTTLIKDVKTGGQLIAQSGFFQPYGNTSDSWELSNWTGNADAMTVVLPIDQYIPGGLRLGRGSLDRVYHTVSDDLTGLDEMTIKIFGYKHYS